VKRGLHLGVSTQQISVKGSNVPSTPASPWALAEGSWSIRNEDDDCGHPSLGKIIKKKQHRGGLSGVVGGLGWTSLTKTARARCSPWRTGKHTWSYSVQGRKIHRKTGINDRDQPAAENWQLASKGQGPWPQLATVRFPAGLNRATSKRSTVTLASRVVR
jgi:hypothetical protein